MNMNWKDLVSAMDKLLENSHENFSTTLELSLIYNESTGRISDAMATAKILRDKGFNGEVWCHRGHPERR